MAGRVRACFSVAAALCALAAPATAQTAGDAPRERRLPRTQAAPPSRLGFGADNDAVPGGVPGNAPFNNQLRKFSDPLGANGSR